MQTGKKWMCNFILVLVNNDIWRNFAPITGYTACGMMNQSEKNTPIHYLKFFHYFFGQLVYHYFLDSFDLEKRTLSYNLHIFKFNHLTTREPSWPNVPTMKYNQHLWEIDVMLSKIIKSVDFTLYGESINKGDRCPHI